MKILIPIKDLLYSLFPDLVNQEESVIIEKLTNYYTVDGLAPSISINDGIVFIDILDCKSDPEQSKWDNVVRLCEKGAFKDAKKGLNDLLTTNPTNSEYNRLMGQILSEEGDQDGAMNYLVDAIRWDTKNKWAYLMLGNIFVKYFNDIDSALKYYNQVLLIDEEDYTTLNNIAGALAKENKFKDATKYFLKAIAINNEYINSYIGLATIKEKEGSFTEAFEYLIQALRTKDSIKTGFHDQLINHTLEIAEKATSLEKDNLVVDSYKSVIESKYNRKISIGFDDSITPLAKLEVAENYNRDKDIILYRIKGSSIITHLIMHELAHLDFISEAREAGVNKLFTTNQSQKNIFSNKVNNALKKLSKKGLDPIMISNLEDMLFDGIALLIYNAPIDLFIENHLYNSFPSLRSAQFISMHKIVQDGIEGVTKGDIINIVPTSVISTTKIYNLTQALLFKDLYGIDLISKFQASKSELSEALRLWDEFNEYRNDRQAGEEYELIENWAKDLNVDDIFSLVDEKAYLATKSVSSNVENLFDNLVEKSKQDSLDRFYKEKEEQGIDVEIIDYIVKALKEFSGKDFDYIKTIAFEIATVGMNGISPYKEGYKIPSLSSREFSGKEFLAYYYVSFKLTHPEIMGELGLPYDIEYDSAQDILKLGLA